MIIPSQTLKSRVELAYYFARLGFKTGAEIGVAAGAFSETMCKVIPGLKLYCIDPWIHYKGNNRGGGSDRHLRNYETAKERLKGYNATLIRKKSIEALSDVADGSLDFVFIDGNHDFDYVLEDIIGWTRKVRSGGIVSGHDYYHFNNSGVIEAVNAYVGFHKIELKIAGGYLRKNPLDDKQPSWWFIKP